MTIRISEQAASFSIATAQRSPAIGQPCCSLVLAQENVIDDLLAGEGTFWFLGDNQNTTRDLADYDGNLVAHYVFDAWGKLIGVTGTLGEALYSSPHDRLLAEIEALDTELADPEATELALISVFESIPTGTSYLYTGKLFDPVSELQYHIDNWLNFNVNQFMSDNGGSENPYEYLGNDPINHVDRSGLANPNGFVGGPIVSVGPPTIPSWVAYTEDVGAPGFWESLIPVWGSGREAIHEFQTGHWGWGIAYTALAVTDVFLVKSLVTGVGKLGGKLLFGTAAKEAGNWLPREQVKLRRSKPQAAD